MKPGTRGAEGEEREELGMRVIEVRWFALVEEESA
jgi:hypothetical protein